MMSTAEVAGEMVLKVGIAENGKPSREVRVEKLGEFLKRV